MVRQIDCTVGCVATLALVSLHQLESISEEMTKEGIDPCPHALCHAPSDVAAKKIGVLEQPLSLGDGRLR